MIDTVLDRTVVLGYTSVGPALRRRWWAPDPSPGSMRGRRVLVTGATSGIGEATAAGLARLGAEVHVHGHDEGRLDAALTRLRAAVPGASFHGELCDLADLTDVCRFAADFGDRVDRLDALIHNAGTMAPRRSETRDGHEFTLAVMVLAPHLLTDRLRERLAASPAGIVTFTSSGGMYGAGLRDDDPEFRRGRYSGSTAYARCKRMQVVLAQMWAERLKLDGIEVASMHPGWVDTKGVAEYLPTFRALTRPLMRSAEQGADTMIWLVATRPSAKGSSRFWHDRRLRSTNYGPARDQDAGQRQRLWDYVAASTRTSTWTPEPDTAKNTRSQRFAFDFEPAYRLPALLFGVRPATAEAWLDGDELRVRFGPWRLRTPRENIASWSETGDFSFVKTAGPAHLSLSDNGVTFATNSKRAVCVRFHQPVRALEPTGRVRHPGATLTVADPQAMIAALSGGTRP